MHKSSNGCHVLSLLINSSACGLLSTSLTSLLCALRKVMSLSRPVYRILTVLGPNSGGRCEESTRRGR